MFGEPGRTNYDIHFSLMGIPVRIHPLFWVIALVLGIGITGSDGTRMIIWIIAVFASIVIHEMGHSLAFRRFGISSHIVLYHLGGLAIPDSMAAAVGFGRGLNPRRQIFISVAGPGAQLLLAALILLILWASRLPIPLHGFPLIPNNWFPEELRPSGNWEWNIPLGCFVGYMLLVNVLWALFNLLPVYPLDGGQIARELFVLYGGGEPIRNSLMLSVATCAGLVFWGIFNKDQFLVIMFLILGINNFMMLQGGYGGFGGGGFGGGGGYGRGRPW